MTRTPERPRDPNQLVKFVIDAATGEPSAEAETPEIAGAKRLAPLGADALSADPRAEI